MYKKDRDLCKLGVLSSFYFTGCNLAGLRVRIFPPWGGPPYLWIKKRAPAPPLLLPNILLYTTPRCTSGLDEGHKVQSAPNAAIARFSILCYARLAAVQP